MGARSADALTAGTGCHRGLQGNSGCRGPGQPWTYKAGAAGVRGGGLAPGLTTAPFRLELRGLHVRPLMCLERGFPSPPKDAVAGALPLKAYCSCSHEVRWEEGAGSGRQHFAPLWPPYFPHPGRKEGGEAQACLRPSQLQRCPGCQGSSFQKQGADSPRTFLLLLCSALGPAWMGLESPLPGKSSASGEAGRIPTLHPFITRSCSKHSLSTSHTPGSEWPTGRRAQKRQQHRLNSTQTPKAPKQHPKLSTSRWGGSLESDHLHNPCSDKWAEDWGPDQSRT